MITSNSIGKIRVDRVFCRKLIALEGFVIALSSMDILNNRENKQLLEKSSAMSVSTSAMNSAVIILFEIRGKL